MLHFSAKGDMGSSISDEGEVKVSVDAIDNFVGDSKIDLIKMDVEGAELKALEGAKKILKRDKPFLALSAYHRKEDLITLPQFINNLNCNYKFYLRKHFDAATLYDFVLYAIPK